MEATNELVTASEASAEGLNITSSNECITKQEFVDNLPRGGSCISLV
nr:MAG TPA: hypothetical protein [Crassvirales sp.]